MIFYKTIRIITIIACIFFFVKCGPALSITQNKVLVYTKTAGFYHSSIPEGIKALKKIGIENGYEVEVSADASVFSEKNLSGYKAVIFLNTTGDVLNNEQQSAFEHFIAKGGGFVGIHAASDTELNWPWYTGLVGAKFSGHPNDPNVLTATIEITDTAFSATKGLPARWERTDEWYNFKDIANDITIVAKLDESTYRGGTNGTNHPIAWYHSYKGGRAFYTGCGHTETSYTEPLFLKHLTGGIQYAMGL